MDMMRMPIDRPRHRLCRKERILSNTWNHSDDGMYFLTIPTFVNYSFSENKKKRILIRLKVHWNGENALKRIRLWNYLLQLSGGQNIDSEESALVVARVPQDLTN